MSRATFDITIGQNDSGVQKTVSLFRVDARLKKAEIDQFHQKIPRQLDVKKAPLIIIEVPSQIPKQKIPFLNKLFQNQESLQHLNLVVKEKDNKIFYLRDFNDPKHELLTYIRKFQKIFSQLNTLDNDLYIEAGFYGIQASKQKHQNQNKQIQPFHALLDNCNIQGVVDLDNRFYDMFCQLVGKISPKFANSPITAMIPLLQDFNLQLEFDSINDINEEIAKDLFNETYQRLDEQLVKITKDIKQKIIIYLNFNKLGFLEIKISPDILPYISGILNGFIQSDNQKVMQL